MSRVVRVVSIGRNLTITIPRALARELGLVARTHVYIERVDGRALRVTLMEDPPNARGAYTPRPGRFNPRAIAPTAR